MSIIDVEQVFKHASAEQQKTRHFGVFIISCFSDNIGTRHIRKLPRMAEIQKCRTSNVISLATFGSCYEVKSVK